MKKMNVMICALLTVLAASSAQAAKNYAIDGSHSVASFKIRHVVSKVVGSFKDFSGTFKFDEKNAKDFAGSFTIKAESIFTNEPKRDDHLRAN